MVQAQGHSKWRVVGLIVGPLLAPGLILLIVLYFHTEVQGEFVAEGGTHAGLTLRATGCRGMSDESEARVVLSSSELPGVYIKITPLVATLGVPAQLVELAKQPADDVSCRLFEVSLVQERTIFYPLIHSAYIESPVDLLFKTKGEVAIDCDTKLLGRIHGRAVFKQCN